jgi:hypothetical protein
VIRLGTLGGYAFAGPRLLGAWSPPAGPGVYAILYRPDPESQRYAVAYVGHADDLAAEGFPFHHRRAACWTARAGSKWKVHVAFLEVPGGTRGHREAIAAELMSRYRPSCNEERFDPAVRAEWVGHSYGNGSISTTPTPE